MPPRGEFTELLLAWGDGDASALEKLLPIAHIEIRRLARRYMRGERADHTLQTSALVNEAYLRLVDCQRVKWEGRAHFMAVWAQLMRRVLVDHARSRSSQKRLGSRQEVSLVKAADIPATGNTDLLELDHSLTRLAVVYPRKAQVIELRFFGGLSVKETAEALSVSEDTVLRDWRLGRSWLLRELSVAK